MANSRIAMVDGTRLIVGPRDAEQRQVSVRMRGVRQDLGALPLETFIEGVREEITTRGRETVAKRHFEPSVPAGV